MELNRLTAISPVDGRYRNKCERLDEFFRSTLLSVTALELKLSIS